ncbi:MAG: glycine betaine ABC transporter substrate-binding protein [Phycisphaerae bacterium]
MSIMGKMALVFGIVVVMGAVMLVSVIVMESADVRVGGKNFTESYVLGEMMALLIEEETDLTVGRRLGLGGTLVCFGALTGGDVDFYAEYTGTGLVNILEQEVMRDPQKVYNEVQSAFNSQFNLVWLEPFGFSNTYTITMRENQAEELGIETISDLAEYLRNGGELRAGFDAEFMERPDGYKALKEAYDFEFPSSPKQLDPGLMYRSAAEGEVDVICGFATDGRIPAYDLTILEDDKDFFPPYDAAPLVRQDTLQQYPEIRDALNKLGGQISPEEMQHLNYLVDEEGRDAKAVAREFLLEKNLISPKEEPASQSQPVR